MYIEVIVDDDGAVAIVSDGLSHLYFTPEAALTALRNMIDRATTKEVDVQPPCDVELRNG